MDNYRLVVFDWDGTLMDSEAHIVQSTAAAFADTGHVVPQDEDIKNIIGLGLREALEQLIPGQDDQTYDAIRERYRHHFLLAPADASCLFPGTLQTLHALKEAGYLLAVATGKSRIGLQRELHRTGLDDIFLASRCADETASKPSPRMLLEIIEELNILPKECIMVGDTEYDMEMAQLAGVNTIAACYGVHTCDRLQRFNPLATINDIQELPKYLHLTI